MKIDSGNITTKIPFIAVDAVDMLTRKTGLTTFTVWRSRNGGTPVAMTTPTITEANETNMPGLYWLLVDEDTTIDSGFLEQQMVFHIEHTGMYPVDTVVTITNLNNRIPAALENGFMPSSTKQFGSTILVPGGSGGQKYGGA